MRQSAWSICFAKLYLTVESKHFSSVYKTIANDNVDQTELFRKVKQYDWLGWYPGLTILVHTMHGLCKLASIAHNVVRMGICELWYFSGYSISRLVIGITKYAWSPGSDEGVRTPIMWEPWRNNADGLDLSSRTCWWLVPTRSSHLRGLL